MFFCSYICYARCTTMNATKRFYIYIYFYSIELKKIFIDMSGSIIRPVFLNKNCFIKSLIPIKDSQLNCLGQYVYTRILLLARN